jgi:FkbM family methyltransferase
MIKKKVKQIINFFGYEVNKKQDLSQSIDQIIKKKISNNPIIVDVGANEGQSIKRFKNLFDSPVIHSFEPIKEEFEKIRQKYQNDKNIFLNNYALGETETTKEFNITKKSGNSSFNNVNQGTKWIEARSREYKTTEKEYVQEKRSIGIDTLENYFLNNDLKKIDLLKIDTQGYEDKILEGSLSLIKEKKIDAVLTEIMFDDVYDKYFSFSDLERYLIPYDFRMVAIDLSNNNLFSGLVFAADVLYLNKKTFNLK